MCTLYFTVYTKVVIEFFIFFIELMHKNITKIMKNVHESRSKLDWKTGAGGLPSFLRSKLRAAFYTVSWIYYNIILLS
jgi:hypothetical protein